MTVAKLNENIRVSIGLMPALGVALLVQKPLKAKPDISGNTFWCRSHQGRIEKQQKDCSIGRASGRQKC